MIEFISQKFNGFIGEEESLRSPFHTKISSCKVTAFLIEGIEGEFGYSLLLNPIFFNSIEVIRRW